jgi:hypothetical protein
MIYEIVSDKKCGRRLWFESEALSFIEFEQTVADVCRESADEYLERTGKTEEEDTDGAGQWVWWMGEQGTMLVASRNGEGK